MIHVRVYMKHWIAHWQRHWYTLCSNRCAYMLTLQQMCSRIHWRQGQSGFSKLNGHLIWLNFVPEFPQVMPSTSLNKVMKSFDSSRFSSHSTTASTLNREYDLVLLNYCSMDSCVQLVNIWCGGNITSLYAVHNYIAQSQHSHLRWWRCKWTV